MAILKLEWPSPVGVNAIYSDRLAGASQSPYDSYNLGDHVGDLTQAVAANRADFQQSMPAQVCWLQQIHSTKVVDAHAASGYLLEADACVAKRAGAACVVMTADCLPLLFCDKQARVVAAAHAGWRGLLNGVIENTVAQMAVEPQQIMVWMGPAIGPQAFEVGVEVRQQFIAKSGEAESAFRPSAAPGKYYADIFSLAKQRLNALSINNIYQQGSCTYSEPERFFSYRRDGQTGRMAAAIWLSQ
jgi:YfiH family protein